jgi:HEAT repeat protein
LNKRGLDKEAIREISLDVGIPSPFQQVIANKTFSVGAFNCEDEAILASLSSLGGGEVPKSAMLLPIMMRDRVIAIAVGHNAEKGVSVGRVTELLPLCASAADAVSRLIAKLRAQKAAGAQPQAAPAQPQAADSSNTLPVADPAMVELFKRLEADDQSVRESAVTEALANCDKVVGHLQFHFPGKLEQERSSNAQKKLSPAEHGPVLDLIMKLGTACSPALSEKMRDADREVRYYATLCAAELRPADVLNEIIERLFDGDENIRSLAVKALSGYPADELSKGLDFVRRALHSEDNARVKLAAEALTRLSDTTAIPDLIDAHSRGGEAAEVSRHALLKLTSQDFGGSTRKWRGWWEKNQDGNRMEWLLEGLGHKNDEIRKNASETLRDLTGEYFGYGHDLPKKQRDKTRKQWQSWWDETGKEKFS